MDRTTLKRELVDQLACWVTEHTSGHFDWRVERRISRAVQLPTLPVRPGRGEVWGVTMVRDEIDVAGLVVDHLLRQGVDHVLISDHLSQDGTREFLTELTARNPRVHLAVDHEPGHFQMEKMTLLSRAAWRAGARWVIPFDADEFWFAEGATVGRFLRNLPAAVVHARTVNMLPSDDAALSADSIFVLDGASTAASKVAFRAHPLALVGPGNHGVARVGPQSEGLYIAHMPYRGAAQVSRKYRAGAAALDAANAPESEGWHWRRGARLTDEGLAQVWASMAAGESVPDLGWPGVDPALRARTLAWRSWDPDGILR